MASTADGCRGRSRAKGPRADDAFRMNCPVAGVNAAEQGMQRVEELLVEKLFLWREITC